MPERITLKTRHAIMLLMGTFHLGIALSIVAMFGTMALGIACVLLFALVVPALWALTYYYHSSITITLRYTLSTCPVCGLDVEEFLPIGQNGTRLWPDTSNDNKPVWRCRSGHMTHLDKWNYPQTPKSAPVQEGYPQKVSRNP